MAGEIRIAISKIGRYVTGDLPQQGSVMLLLLLDGRLGQLDPAWPGAAAPGLAAAAQRLPLQVAAGLAWPPTSGVAAEAAPAGPAVHPGAVLTQAACLGLQAHQVS